MKSVVSKSRMIGIGAIALGIILTFMSSEFVDKGGVLFYGLIIYGLWRLFKSFGKMNEIVW